MIKLQVVVSVAVIERMVFRRSRVQQPCIQVSGKEGSHSGTSGQDSAFSFFSLFSNFFMPISVKIGEK